MQITHTTDSKDALKDFIKDLALLETWIPSTPLNPNPRTTFLSSVNFAACLQFEVGSTFSYTMPRHTVPKPMYPRRMLAHLARYYGLTRRMQIKISGNDYAYITLWTPVHGSQYSLLRTSIERAMSRDAAALLNQPRTSGYWYELLLKILRDR